MRYESDKALAFLPCVIENASINCPFLFSEAIKSPVSYLISGISKLCEMEEVMQEETLMRAFQRWRKLVRENKNSY